MEKLKIVIAGGSGFIGQAMAERWGTDHEVVILGRQKAVAENNSYTKGRQPAGERNVIWDGKTPDKWVAELEGADLLINLAGRSVNCRYTAEHKAEIMNSRLDATHALGEAVKQCRRPPRLWINGTSATIYRHAEDHAQDEATGETGHGFSVAVCKAWEKAFNEYDLPDTRKAILRMTIVLGKDGALVPYARLAKLGLGGPQGDGRQMFSWVHITDLCRMVEWLWQHPEQAGTYNAAAPDPVPNRVFMKALRSVLKVPFGLPAPAWVLKAGAAVIGTEAELLLKSRWVMPVRLLNNGFTFQYPRITTALKDLL